MNYSFGEITPDTEIWENGHKIAVAGDPGYPIGWWVYSFKADMTLIQGLPTVTDAMEYVKALDD